MNTDILTKDDLRSYIKARDVIDDSVAIITCLSGMMEAYEQTSDDKITHPTNVIAIAGKTINRNALLIIEHLESLLPKTKAEEAYQNKLHSK